MRNGTIIFLILLAGCSGRWHVQKAQKKGVLIAYDTIKTELILPGKTETFFDTVQFKQIFIDTIEFKSPENEIKGKIKLTRQADTVEVFVQVDCPPDTVEVITEIKTSIDCPKCKGLPLWLFWSGLSASFMAGLFIKLWLKYLTGL